MEEVQQKGTERRFHVVVRTLDAKINRHEPVYSL